MKTIKISNKEILVQLALGTFNISLLRALVQETNNPTILTAAAKTFVKLNVEKDSSISSNLDADIITNMFMNNKHTPPPVKSYVIVARQIKNIERRKQNLINSHEYHPPYFYGATIKSLQEEFKKLHLQLFDD